MIEFFLCLNAALKLGKFKTVGLFLQPSRSELIADEMLLVSASPHGKVKVRLGISLE